MSNQISGAELRATLSLAAILSGRLLGLFMILPVFSVYAEKLKGNTPLLIGMVLGIYGLFQALLQLPFGILSDKVGRKPVIATGLIIFALGSVVAAMSTTIYGVILGRALQGAGAIGSVVTAYIADLTRPEHRTKAMAMLGMTIGLSFTAALVLGPLLNPWIHVSGIFWLTTLLALGGLLLLFTVVPAAPSHISLLPPGESLPQVLKKALVNMDLLRLDIGVFVLHAILTATFIAIPLMLQSLPNFSAKSHWYLYLITLVMSFIIMVPLIIFAEKRKKQKFALLGSIVFIIMAELILLAVSPSMLSIACSLLVFFIAFNVLEASLPSMLAKQVPPQSRGTAMGVFSSSQYLGIFMGGVVGGSLLQRFHTMSGIFIFCIVLAAIWLLIATGTKTTQAVH